MPILGPILPNPSQRLENPLSMEVFNGKIMGKYRKLNIAIENDNLYIVDFPIKNW